MPDHSGNVEPGINEKNCGKLSDDDAKNITEDIPQILEVFDIIGKVGSGTFSSVFLAKPKLRSDISFAIKYITPLTHPSRTAMELSCLIDLGGKDNILPVSTSVRHRDRVAIIMPYFECDDFKSYVKNMTQHELKFYMWNLLLALRRVHSAGIIHRDIKPRNFLFNRESKRFALIDFGLAQKVSEVAMARPSVKRKSSEDLDQRGLSHTKKLMGSFNNENSTPKTKLLPSKKVELNDDGDYDCRCYNKPQVCNKCLGRPSQQACRAGTPGYRPPEVLMKYTKQTTAVDVWAAGVMFITLVSGRYPFFSSSDDLTCLRHITKMLGYDAVKKAAAAIGKSFLCSPAYPPSDLKDVCRRIRKSQIAKTTPAPKLDDLQYVIKANEEMAVFKDDYNEDTEIINLNEGANDNSEGDTEIIDYPQAVVSSPNPTAATNETLPAKASSSSSSFIDQSDFVDLLPDVAFDLLSKMLDPNPLSRITAEEALRHPYFCGLDFDGLH